MEVCILLWRTRNLVEGSLTKSDRLLCAAGSRSSGDDRDLDRPISRRYRWLQGLLPTDQVDGWPAHHSALSVMDCGIQSQAQVWFAARKYNDELARLDLMINGESYCVLSLHLCHQPSFRQQELIRGHELIWCIINVYLVTRRINPNLTNIILSSNPVNKLNQNTQMKAIASTDHNQI